MQLENVVARKILNSRKEATIEVVAEANGARVIASAPSGASKGKHEVKDVSSRGIDFSVTFLNEIGRRFVNDKISFETFEDLAKIEETVRRYDQTKNLEFVGGNALYAIENAVLKLMALSQKQEPWKFLLQDKRAMIPRPLGNCIGGGMHTHQPNKTDFQEFLLIPKARSFFDSCFVNIQAYKEIKEALAKKDARWRGVLTDENAFATTLDNISVIELLQEILERIKSKFEMEIELGLDVAASTFFKAGKYRYSNFSLNEREKALTEEGQLEFMAEIAKKYSLAYIEDPFQSDNFSGFAKLHSGTKTLVCGDDLTCTHPDIVEKAIINNAINALIVKPNQIGSLIETKKVIDLAKKNEIACVISHRSGDTCDDFIADLCIGWQLPFIKTGIIGKEREAKLNRLVKIEKEL